MPDQSLSSIFSGQPGVFQPATQATATPTATAPAGRPSLDSIFKGAGTGPGAPLAHQPSSLVTGTDPRLQGLPSTSTAGNFFSSLGSGVSQTAHALTAPIVGGAKEVANDTSQAFQGGLQQGREGAA